MMDEAGKADRQARRRRQSQVSSDLTYWTLHWPFALFYFITRSPYLCNHVGRQIRFLQGLEGAALLALPDRRDQQCRAVCILFSSASSWPSNDTILMPMDIQIIPLARLPYDEAPQPPHPHHDPRSVWNRAKGLRTI